MKGLKVAKYIKIKKNMAKKKNNDIITIKDSSGKSFVFKRNKTKKRTQRCSVCKYPVVNTNYCLACGTWFVNPPNATKRRTKKKSIKRKTRRKKR